MPESDEDEPTEQHQPHRYEIRGRFFSLHVSFKIKDANGSKLYQIRSKPWSMRNELFFEDMNGRVLMKIHQKGIHLLDQYSISSCNSDGGECNQPMATIRQKLTFSKHVYKIYSIYGEYKLKGSDAFDHSFTLEKKEGPVVASISKKFFSISDIYNINIIETNHPDHRFILALICTLHCSIYGL